MYIYILLYQCTYTHQKPLLRVSPQCTRQILRRTGTLCSLPTHYRHYRPLTSLTSVTFQGDLRDSLGERDTRRREEGSNRDLRCVRIIPYSGKFSRGSIFVDRRASNISRFNFRRYEQSCQYVHVHTSLFCGFNFRGRAINREKHENWTPRKFPAIWYTAFYCHIAGNF